MNIEDIGPILAIAENEARKETRAKWKADLLADQDSLMPSQRCMRARHFASQMMHMMRDFIPAACREAAFEELVLTAYGSDIEIMQVSPERDAVREAALRKAAITLAPQMIIKQEHT